MTDKRNLDEMIKAALTGQDREILESTEELGWFELGLKQFGGKLGWVTWVIMVVQSVMFIAALFYLYRCYFATDLLLTMKSGITGAVLLLMATQLKLSLAPQMQADRVIREVKRLQLLMANHDTTND